MAFIGNKNKEILRMTGEVHRRNKYFHAYKQLNTFDHLYQVHKCSDYVNKSLLIGTLVSTNLINTLVQYLAKCPRPDINNGPGGDSNSAHILAS